MTDASPAAAPAQPSVELFTHLLAPTDGTPASHAAAERAVAIAAAMHARVTFFHAKPERRQSFFGGEGGAFVDQMPADEFDRQADLRAGEYLAALQTMAHAAGVHCDTVVAASGAPYEGIIETAQAHGCDLIVMASHGRRGIKSLILGSETQKVLTHSKIPVLVYR